MIKIRRKLPKQNVTSVLLLAIPVYFELISAVISGIVDSYWLTTYNKNAVGAVATATFLENLLVGIALVVTLGTTVIVARKIGEKDYKGVKCAFVSGFITTIILTLIIIIMGLWMRESIASSLISSQSSELLIYIKDYIIVLFPGLLILNTQALVDSIFKGNKDTKTPMKAAIITNIVNLILDPILIFGLFGMPKMGIMGAALATLIGRSVALSWTLIKLLKSKIIKLIFSSETQLEIFRHSKKIIKTGLPLASDFLIRTLGGVLLIRIISRFGQDQVSAYGICTKVLLFCTMFFYAIRQASCILVSRARGEGKIERSKIIAKHSISYGLIVATVVAVFIFIFGKNITYIFTRDTILVEACTHLFIFLGIYLVPLSIIISLSGTFIGMEKGSVIFLITIIGVFIQNTSAYILSEYFNNIMWVWISMILSTTVQVCVGLFVYKKKVIPHIASNTDRPLKEGVNG